MVIITQLHKGCSDNGRAPTGCVATAVAQIMRYHQHPSRYNWRIMPNFISWGSTTNNGITEIATLMRDIGDNVGMDYKCSGSGADTENVVNALDNKFGYSSTLRYIDYNVGAVVSELNNKRPVLMDGYHTKQTTGWWIFKRTNFKNGHAWVCDGWRETRYIKIHNPKTQFEYRTSTSSGTYLHMNWGWGVTGMRFNNNNGWFKYDDFKIKGITTKGKNTNYQYKKKMIIGIKP